MTTNARPHTEKLETALERILPRVQKPGRYTGGEWGSVVKDWDAVHLHVALCFPDVYEIGMSNLGLAVLYDILNHQPGVLAERVYTPWPDMQAQLLLAGLPLYSLENKRPLHAFDLLGFSLPYEQLYTNVLTMLELGGLPLLASQRDASHPIVIAGGHAAFNPEPMSDFIDAFVIGEGEEVILDIVHCISQARGETGRDVLLRQLAAIPGLYVPRLYDVRYHADGTTAQVSPNAPGLPARITKRVVVHLPPPPTRFIVPFLDITHNRAMVEIMRGCTRGCRFCQAGFVTRPVRQRPPEQILAAIDDILHSTGYDEVGLLSLSSSDYARVGELVERLKQKYAGQNVTLSLPSLRIESFSVELADALTPQAAGQDGRRTGFTFAPEAATEAQRRRINKFIPNQQVLETARQVFEHGWRTIKLYFMIGHPDETLDDVQAIAELGQAVLAAGRQVHGRAAQVNISCSTFIPKPHTPFQWTALDNPQAIQHKQALLKSQLRRPGLKLSWVEPEETFLEAVLSRGDRRLGQVILHAWQLGAQFEAWSEHFKPAAWQQAFAQAGLDPAFYVYRPRALDELFPWDHIDTGVHKRYLLQEYRMSQRGEIRPDCRETCFACGIAALRPDGEDVEWPCK